MGRLTSREYQARYRARHPDEHRARWLKRIADAQRDFDALRGAPCADCGGTFPPECMDFDHVRGEKVAPVSRLKKLSAARIAVEIAKCDLVCANCHRIRTRRRARERLSAVATR